MLGRARTRGLCRRLAKQPSPPRFLRWSSELRIKRPNQFRLFQAPLKTQPRHRVLFFWWTVIQSSGRSTNDSTACAVNCQFSITLSETKFRGQVPNHVAWSLPPNRGRSVRLFPVPVTCYNAFYEVKNNGRKATHRTACRQWLIE
jgi:hypothetical protein